MATRHTTIIDYGVGNLLSVARAFEYVGATVEVTADHQKIAEADRLVLPGVGAFGRAVEGLRQASIIEPLNEFLSTGRPLLGICVGMQMMFEESSEFGAHAGLALLPGRVRDIRTLVESEIRIPHIGWGRLTNVEGADWSQSVLKDIKDDDSFYFVHSFAANPEPQNLMASTMLEDQPITAVVSNGPLTGCQFHPEKSGPSGLKIIKQFSLL